MRVLYFTRDYTPHDHRFLTSLVDSGHEVHYLRLERRGHQQEDRALPPAVHQVHWAGGQKPFEWRDLPVLYRSLRRVLREVQPDVVQAGPIQTAAFLVALAGCRSLAATSWGSDLLKDADRSTVYRWITRFTLRRAQVLIGDCQAVQDKAVEFGVPADRVYAFPWGIDLERFHPDCGDDARARAFRERQGWQNSFVILSLRSWEPVYGVDVMLRGFARACQAVETSGEPVPDLRLLMLGGGSQAPLVHRIIQENHLEERVYLGGQVKQADLPMMYHAADLYLSAAHSDGSSVSLMEALGSGLPVLITDIASNREWVTHGKEGWLFPDGDDGAVAECILRAARLTTEERAAIRARSRARAEQRANWKENFQVLLAAYRRAAALARPGDRA